MVGKKGLSPIIATVLLIAFAVALGAMIMNWSSNLVAGGALESACDSIKISIKAPVCFEDNKINFKMANIGEETIHALLMRLSSPELDQDVQIKNSRLSKGLTGDYSVPSVKPEEFTIEIIPMLKLGEEIELCPLPVHITNELSDCE
ncbi:archaellin/type IV pilin N-terminal domain-containing protein [Nanoarchaeota archaeon]